MDKVLLGYLVQTASTVKTVSKVLLVWLVLSVPLGLLVGRVLRGRRVQTRKDLLARLDRLARPVNKENQGPLVRQEWMVDPDRLASRDYPEIREYLARQGQQDLKDHQQPDSSAPPGSAQTN